MKSFYLYYSTLVLLFIANAILQVFSSRDFYFVLVVVMWLLGVDSMTKIKWNKIDVAVAASMFLVYFHIPSPTTG